MRFGIAVMVGLLSLAGCGAVEAEGDPIERAASKMATQGPFRTESVLISKDEGEAVTIRMTGVYDYSRDRFATTSEWVRDGETQIDRSIAIGTVLYQRPADGRALGIPPDKRWIRYDLSDDDGQKDWPTCGGDLAGGWEPFPPAEEAPGDPSPPEEAEADQSTAAETRTGDEGVATEEDDDDGAPGTSADEPIELGVSEPILIFSDSAFSSSDGDGGELEWLRALGAELTAVGRDIIRNEPTTHYTAEVDVRDTIRRTLTKSGMSDDAADCWTREMPAGTEYHEVWIDDAAVLRRTRTSTMWPGDPAQEELSTTDYYYDVSGDGGIEAPPANEVVDEAELDDP